MIVAGEHALGVDPPSKKPPINCIETMILRGHTREVVQFAESLIAEKDVRPGKFNVIPVESEANGRAHHHHHHVHLRPHR